MDALDLVEDALNFRQPMIYDEIDEPAGKAKRDFAGQYSRALVRPFSGLIRVIMLRAVKKACAHFNSVGPI
jgi:hypothetical protein